MLKFSTFIVRQRTRGAGLRDGNQVIDRQRVDPGSGIAPCGSEARAVGAKGEAIMLAT